MNPEAILGLIADLYSQVSYLTRELQKAQAQLAAQQAQPDE